MKILITGSSGYIGSNYIKFYKSHYQFMPFSLQHQEIKNIEFNTIDVIIHAAAFVHQKEEYDKETYYQINTTYPLELAKLAKQNKVKQFVFISTVAVYGNSNQIVSEKSNCSPITPYAISKLEAEKALLKLEDKNFIVSIIRSPMVYGKNAPGNIGLLINLVKKMPFLPLSNIDNKRSFIYIGNLCHLINEIIIQQQNGIFLATDDKAISTSELITLIAKNMNKKVYLFQIPFFETVLRFLKPSIHQRLYGSLKVDNSVTKQKLHLTNPYTVEDGIKLMLSQK